MTPSTERRSSCLETFCPTPDALMDGLLALANRRRTGRALELGIAKFRDPQAGVDVVEIHQAIEQRTVAGHRAGLPAPGEWQIRTEAFGVTGPETGNLAALAIEITAQFAGDIEHSRAAAVVAFIKHVVRGPEIVRPSFRYFILRHFPRMLHIGNIHDVQDGAHRDAVSVVEFENGRENLIPHKQVVLIAEHAVSARQPAVSIKLVMVEVILADQFGILRAAAGHAVAHIEDD